MLKLVATGATNQQVARALVISPNTVKVHLRNIFEKLGVQSRTEATMEAVRRGLVSVRGAVAGVAADGVAPEADTGGTEVPVAPLVVDLPVSLRSPVAGWQRAYMLAALLVVVIVALAPVWWRARGAAPAPTPFSDAGLPAIAAAAAARCGALDSQGFAA